MADSFLAKSRFYGILDRSYVTPDQWISKCQALIDGGADLIQLRAKNVDTSEREKLLNEILPLFNHCSIPLILNDDLPLAERYPEVGLHIGQDDVSIEEARAALGADRIIGLSTHSIDQVEEALQKAHLLSYFAVGPVFSTQTKPNYIPVGLQLVTDVSHLNPSIPFFCIGGIHRNNLGDVVRAGASRVVIVSDILCDADTMAAVKQVQQKMKMLV